MAYNPYYAPYYRPMNYYNTSIPQENPNMQNAQQMPMQQPMVQQPMQMPILNMSPNNDMIWVLSEGEAQSYPVAPNNSVILWDKNSDVVYIKSVNAQNVPSFRVLDYKERTPDNAPKTPDKHVCECGGKFVRIDKFNALESEFKALRNELDELKAKPKAKATKKIIDEVEDE
jgi:hypothetical protein